MNFTSSSYLAEAFELDVSKSELQLYPDLDLS